ncbi:hypothetical protein [Actinoplanes awajinensis]|nr:hypothetical protein [Actinoplanes awajinensis]
MSMFAGGKRDLRVTLQHEFGHAVTLMGIAPQRTFADRDTVLTEGIAEYIGEGAASPLRSERLPEVRRYLRDNAVLDLDFSWPRQESSVDTVSGAYGVGHFAVTCLVKKFGQDKMFAYFDARVRQGQDTDRASETVFGKPWQTVSSDCAAWIYKTAGVKR